MRARLAIAASGIEVELREILLRDKPSELLEASPKGTVPVVITDRVIEESYDIMLWALKQNDPDNWLENRDEALILECDGPFKSALDRYKYNKDDAMNARGEAVEFIMKVDELLAKTPYLSGHNIGLTDMAIVTFIRQFANVDRNWFNGEPFIHIALWLEGFLASDAFLSIMQKYPKWQASDTPTYFPERP